jgi:hypothetical protein
MLRGVHPVTHDDRTVGKGAFLRFGRRCSSLGTPQEAVAKYGVCKGVSCVDILIPSAQRRDLTLQVFDLFQLTFESTVVSICTTCSNILQPIILTTQCIYVFHMILTINSDCFPKQH